MWDNVEMFSSSVCVCIIRARLVLCSSSSDFTDLCSCTLQTVRIPCSRWMKTNTYMHFLETNTLYTNTSQTMQSASVCVCVPVCVCVCVCVVFCPQMAQPQWSCEGQWIRMDVNSHDIRTLKASLKSEPPISTRMQPPVGWRVIKCTGWFCSLSVVLSENYTHWLSQTCTASVSRAVGMGEKNILIFWLER